MMTTNKFFLGMCMAMQIVRYLSDRQRNRRENLISLVIHYGCFEIVHAFVC